jgi:hypothetical protein
MTQVVDLKQFKKGRERGARAGSGAAGTRPRGQRARSACAIPSFEKLDGDALGSRSQESPSEVSSLG